MHRYSLSGSHGRESTRSDKGPRPRRLSELAPGEQLLLRSLRHWLVGYHTNDATHWAWVMHELERAFDAEVAHAILAGIEKVLRSICNYSRRPVQHHQPCCPCLGNDEALLMALVAACQAHDPRAAARIAVGFVGPADGVGDLIAAGSALGAALQRGGQHLPHSASPHVPAAPRSPATASSALH